MSKEFTWDYKCKALGLVEKHNGNVNTVADILQVPARLLSCWTRHRTLLHQKACQDSTSVPVSPTAETCKLPKVRKPKIFVSSPLRIRPQPPILRAWHPEYRRRHGLIRRPYMPENFDPRLPLVYRKTVPSSLHNNASVQSPKDSPPSKNATDDFQLSKGSERLFSFLTSIQSLITDTLKLKQNQIGTMYPIEVEMSLPDAVQYYCDFKLLQPKETLAPDTIRFNVLLSATASGAKLKPLMVVNGTSDLLDLSSVPRNVDIVVTDNISFDMKSFAIWKQDIWLKDLSIRGNGKCLVIFPLDNPTSSLTPVYRDVGFIHENTAVAVMPTNLVHLLHPAIVYWITPFAETLRVRLLKWLQEAEECFITFGNRQTLSYELFAIWVSEAWEEIKRSSIVESFEGCGLTNFTSMSLHSELQRHLDSHSKCRSTSVSEQTVIIDVSDNSNS